MALLLSIETSTHSFSCALHDEGKLVVEEKSVADQTTASMLAVMIKKLFSKSQLKKNKLSAVVIAAGPGSYTGLRIGVATGKGICYALEIPLISVDTLKLMAFQASALIRDGLLCPMLDARRMEVYCALFDQDLKVIQNTQAKIIDANSFSDQLHRPIYFFGEGADKCRDTLVHSNAKFMSGIKPSANALGELGYAKFQKSEFEGLEHFEPFYLKDFVVKKPKSVS
ncbi:MAG TPA: tRNA (adenosine(37)-N6)-threonylcarbamoyltransferase complex dimerization subunit type 1 TsaB [Cyclobacteriaceae bacterium]|nr:tRNA (adenosine(37)-N6)-threonylcarbamoyltransferase complex dimerization subunit type 1 TsaB [Cyclobacteriaceae bacterium]